MAAASEPDRFRPASPAPGFGAGLTGVTARRQTATNYRTEIEPIEQILNTCFSVSYFLVALDIRQLWLSNYGTHYVSSQAYRLIVRAGNITHKAFFDTFSMLGGIGSFDPLLVTSVLLQTSVLTSVQTRFGPYMGKCR